MTRAEMMMATCDKTVAPGKKVISDINRGKMSFCNYGRYAVNYLTKLYPSQEQ